jgi:hypothetical protein
MADLSGKQAPNLTERAREAKRARERREAEALRANLRRRKAPEDGASAERKEDEPHHG